MIRQKEKETTLEARVEWIRGQKVEEGVNKWRTILEFHLPQPSASFDVSEGGE